MKGVQRIIQLDWKDISEEGEELLSIEAEFSFGSYTIYEEDQGGRWFNLWYPDDKLPTPFRLLLEAKMRAQKDFEERVIKCLLW